jgi:hypothetical protein
MAALRVEARADGKKPISRLAHHTLNVHPHTWRTFVDVMVNQHGAVAITVTRDGSVVYTFALEAEA